MCSAGGFEEIWRGIRLMATMPEMHDRHAYREDCAGCQIAIMNDRGERLPDSDPVMRVAMKVWLEASLEERQACNRVWVHLSRTPEDFGLMKGVMERIEKAMKN